LGFTPVITSLALASSGGTILLNINTLKLVPEAGLEQVEHFSPAFAIHSQHLRHQRHAASYVSNTPIIKHFHRFVKSGYYAPINHPVLTNYSVKTRSLALSLELKLDVGISLEFINP
jgi:hypothetical protein